MGLTRIIKGFNGENLREPKCGAVYATEKDKQTERTEMNRQTDRQLRVRISSAIFTCPHIKKPEEEIC